LVLFRIPDTVQAMLARQRPGAQAVDYVHLVLRYDEGVVATLQAGMLVSRAFHAPRRSRQCRQAQA
jgi:hypothetical protein